MLTIVNLGALGARRRTVRLVLVVAMAAGLLAVAPPGRSAEGPILPREEYLLSRDGVTRLHAFVYRSPDIAPDQPTPVIVEVTPYAGTGGNLVSVNIDPLRDPNPAADRFIREALVRGYTFARVSLRGTGGSGGCYDLGGPGEQADAQGAVHWARTAAWSDGRVGMVGHSYPGSTQLMAIGADDAAYRPDAAVIGAPPIGYPQLYMNNGVRKSLQGLAYPPAYLAGDLVPPSLHSPQAQHETSLTGTATNPGCYATTTAGAYSDDPNSQYWRDRDLATRVAGTTVPVLYQQGFYDHQVRPSQFLPIWNGLKGPRLAYLGPWDHSIPRSDDGTLSRERTLDWLDRWLQRDLATDEVAKGVLVQNTDGRWRREKDWPPRDAVARALPLLPGSYRDAPGNHGETDWPQLYGRAPVVPLTDLPLVPNGVGTWTFTPPLAEAAHVAGVPLVDVQVDTLAPDAQIVAMVYDVDEDSRATLITRGAYRLRGTKTVTFELYPQDYIVEAGHRIGVLLGAADDLWYSPGTSGLDVTVTSGSLRLPVLERTRVRLDPATDPYPFRSRQQPPPLQLDPAVVAERTSTSEAR